MSINQLCGKRVLIRVDFNVPISGKKILDDFRIRASLPIIQKLLKIGSQVFLITHLEKDGLIPHLDQVAKHIQKTLDIPVRFLKGEITPHPRLFSERIIIFDNIRLNKGEKKNDMLFAKRLARWGDYYINDAFAVCHREHASVVGVPKFLPGETGPLVNKEIKELSRAFNPQTPFLFILGGKKFSTKEPLVAKFLKIADTIFIGGALANTFLYQRGLQIGKSVVDQNSIPKEILYHKNLLFPSDVVVLRAKRKIIVSINGVELDDVIYDAGPKTLLSLSGLLKKSKFILWNGTLGLCEKGFCDGTKALAIAIGKSKAYSIVGGGDTVAAIRELKLEKNFDFISTGGGAMLEFLAKGTLPGIEAIKKRK